MDSLVKLWCCQTIVREGMEEMTRDVVEGCETVASRLRHDNATWLSGAV